MPTFRSSKCGLSRGDGLGILAQRLRSFGGGRRQVCAGVDPVNTARLCRPPTRPPWPATATSAASPTWGGPISSCVVIAYEEGGRRCFRRRRPGWFQRNQKCRSFIAPAASSALTWRAPAKPPEARRPVEVEAPAGVEALGDQNLGDRARVGRHEQPEPAVRGGPWGRRSLGRCPDFGEASVGLGLRQTDLDEARLVGDARHSRRTGAPGFRPGGCWSGLQSRSPTVGCGKGNGHLGPPKDRTVRIAGRCLVIRPRLKPSRAFHSSSLSDLART